jgi:hypothetical protein
VPVVELGPDTTLVADESIILDAGNDGAFYTWSTGAVQPYDPGIRNRYPVEILVEVSTMAGCSASDSIFIDLDQG